MPSFSDGQDPREATEGDWVFHATSHAAPPEPVTPGETIGAAFRQYNPILWIIDAASRSRPDQTPVPSYDPIPLLVGTKHESLIGQSLGDVNPAQTKARMDYFDANQRDRQILAAAGGVGTINIIVAIAANPLWILVIWFLLKQFRAAYQCVEDAVDEAENPDKR